MPAGKMSSSSAMAMRGAGPSFSLQPCLPYRQLVPVPPYSDTGIGSTPSRMRERERERERER
ncbi:hypothetical protein GCM10009646_14570 [Streptomyces aureus]